MSLIGADFTTTKVPGGYFGCIDPVRIVYGVALAILGTITETATAATSATITNQATTRTNQTLAILKLLIRSRLSLPPGNREQKLRIPGARRQAGFTDSGC